jgi:TolB-like protein
VLVGSLLAAEYSVEAAASKTASELSAGLTKALGKPATLVVLTSFGGGSGFDEALLAALKQQGVKVADSKSVKASIDEAVRTPGASDAALAELAVTLGAQVVITGRIDQAGADLRVNAKATDVRSGKVLASASASFASATPSAPKPGGVSAATLQGELRRLADVLAGGINASFKDARYSQFAVVTFEETGSSTSEKQLGTLVAAELTTLLQRDHGLMIIERTQLAKVLDELALGQTGLTDPQKSAEVGKLLGAEALIVGNVAEAGDRYLANARVVMVANAQVAFSTQGQLPAADLVALSSEAVVLRTRAGAVYRSLLLPGWGQLYNREGEKGAVFAGGEVLAAAAAVFFHLRGQSFHDDYMALASDADDQQFTDLRDREETSYRQRNIAIWVAVGIHAVNVIDALLFGRSFDSPSPAGGGAMGATPNWTIR